MICSSYFREHRPWVLGHLENDAAWPSPVPPNVGRNQYAVVTMAYFQEREDQYAEVTS